MIITRVNIQAQLFFCDINLRLYGTSNVAVDTFQNDKPIVLRIKNGHVHHDGCLRRTFVIIIIIVRFFYKRQVWNFHGVNAGTPHRHLSSTSVLLRRAVRQILRLRDPNRTRWNAFVE